MDKEQKKNLKAQYKKNGHNEIRASVKRSSQWYTKVSIARLRNERRKYGYQPS
jgi:hypothetical protein